MDGDIACGAVILIQGRQHAEHLLIKGAVKIPDGIGIGGACGGKAFDDPALKMVAVAVQKHTTLPVQDPDIRGQEMGHEPDLGINAGLHVIFGVEAVGVGIRHEDSLVVEGVGALPQQIVIGHPGRKQGHGDKADEAEDQVAENEFQVEGLSHFFTLCLLFPFIVEKNGFL